METAVVFVLHPASSNPATVAAPSTAYSHRFLRTIEFIAFAAYLGWGRAAYPSERIHG
ncbi:MAG: hypothetical protein ABSC63_00770 [Candidatus Binataceae bacterium]